MKVELEDVGPLAKKLSITVPANQVEGRFAIAYRELRREIELPGFRKGKVPRKLLEKRFGDRLAAKVAPELAAKALEDAVAQHELDTVGEPELDLGEARPGQPFRFTAKLALRPHPVVSDYCGVRVVREEPTLSEQELEGHLESMRRQSGVLESVEEDRPVADGDVVDVTLTFSDAEYGDLVREHQLLRLPDDPNHPFLLQLVRGLRRGQMDAAEVQIPSDYPLPDWAGRSCRAAVLLHAIKELRPPPLDAAFAQRLGHEDVEGLRAALRGELLETMLRRCRERETRNLIEALIERNPFEVPRAMVDDRAQALVESIAAQLVDGISEAMFLTLDDLEAERREEVLEEAEFSVRREVILEVIGRQEGIRLEEEEREAGIERMAARIGQPVGSLRSALLEGGMAKFEAKLLEDKIIAWLLERAEIVSED